MATYRLRGVSPPPRRHEESRTSTGPVFSTGFDTRYAQQSRHTIDTLTSSRNGGERLYDAQPISRKNYVAPGSSTAQSKTQYAVRSRNNSVAGDEGRTPLRILPPPPSPSRARPLVTNLAHDMPRSPLTRGYYPNEESDRYILPAVSSPSGQRRHMGPVPADSTNAAPAGRDRRQKGGYRVAGSRVYHTGGSLVRQNDVDDYSYTTPQEQFDRDYPPAEYRPRRSSYVRRERPTSVSDFEDWKTTPSRKKESGPPPAVRQFNKIDSGDHRYPTSRSGNHSDNERDLEKPRRSHSLRVPVSVHQNHEERPATHGDDRKAQRALHNQSRAFDDEPSYSSDRENYRPSSHYERHRQRPHSREDSQEKSSKHHGVAASGLSGLVAAGLTTALVKKPREKNDESDRDELREVKDRYAPERDHRFEEVGRDRERIADRPRERAADSRDELAPPDQRKDKVRKERSEGGSVGDSHTDGHRHRRRHHHRRPEPKSDQLESDDTSDERKDVEVASEVDRARRPRDFDPEDSPLPHRERRHSHARQRFLSEDEKPEQASTEIIRDEEDETRAVPLQLVEPPREREPEPKPKGILKPARQVPFPEDPNPTREGVAPLKDAGKKGVPPGARWTKINRMLVNPAALDAAHERYEERSDYVIVLRVLSREDIQKLADKTKEIREARELEWNERSDRKGRKDESGDDSDISSDDERGPPLAIEAAPSAPNMDPRYQQSFPPSTSTSTRPEPDVAAMAGLGIRS